MQRLQAPRTKDHSGEGRKHGRREDRKELRPHPETVKEHRNQRRGERGRGGRQDPEASLTKAAKGKVVLRATSIWHQEPALGTPQGRFHVAPALPPSQCPSICTHPTLSGPLQGCRATATAQSKHSCGPRLGTSTSLRLLAGPRTCRRTGETGRPDPWPLRHKWPWPLHPHNQLGLDSNAQLLWMALKGNIAARTRTANCLHTPSHADAEEPQLLKVNPLDIWRNKEETALPVRKSGFTLF